MRRRETTPREKSLKAPALVWGSVALAMVVSLLDLFRGSVAAHWHDEFLVGALFDSKVLICKPSP